MIIYFTRITKWVIFIYLQSKVTIYLVVVHFFYFDDVSYGLITREGMVMLKG
jgi:hypothetical protein